MSKDTSTKQDKAILWADLGFAHQVVCLGARRNTGLTSDALG